MVRQNLSWNGVSWASGSEYIRTVRIILCVMVSGLDHESRDYAVEENSVVIFDGGQADEVLLVLWSVLIELDADSAHGGYNIKLRLRSQGVRIECQHRLLLFRLCLLGLFRLLVFLLFLTALAGEKEEAAQRCHD